MPIIEPVSTTTRELVCEGVACNPNLSIADSLVKRYRAGEHINSREGGLRESIQEPAIVGILRRQKHTTHRQLDRPTVLGVSSWQCTVCGHVRRF